jgi:hypothetical protein
MMAFTVSAMAMVAAMVLDFGLVRVDRQIDRSAADAAVLAGLHGLNANNDDGVAHSYLGVCAAVRYLRANDPRFANASVSTGWTDALGANTANGCTTTALLKKGCRAGDKTTWAKWHWSGQATGEPAVDVTIQSGFTFAGAPVFAEDSLSASSGDTAQGGCDTLAVTISQSRAPGLGSLATSHNLSTSIRSVGRVQTVPGDSAPAMLLLKRTGCPALRAGNSGGGSGTWIHVLGAVTSAGFSAPGTIHSDSDGSGCTGGSNSNVFIGAQDNAIVAYAAPIVSNPTAPDPAKPGLVTSVAADNGAAAGVVRDSLDYVYGSSALSSGGTKNEVIGRPLVTRKLIDNRYFTGVKAAISGAASVFAAAAAPAGFTKSLSTCTPTQADVDALNLTAADTLYVNCTANNGFNGSSTGLVIKAGAVYFKGVVNPAGTLQMPNATKVYIANSINKAAALTIGNNVSFEMNDSAANMSGGLCSTGVNSSKATLFIQTGSMMQTSSSGTLRLCRTTAFLLGGQSNGCVPATAGTAPTSTPCSGTMGTGQFNQTGGNIDWTAPNAIDITLDPVTSSYLPAAVTAWADANGPEDLALWAESGTDSSHTYSMAGGGAFHVRGVFMVPNADPFKLSGGSGLNLTNAQYIASSIELNGGTQITMQVDPNSAVVLPDLGLVGLIR